MDVGEAVLRDDSNPNANDNVGNNEAENDIVGGVSDESNANANGNVDNIEAQNEIRDNVDNNDDNDIETPNDNDNVQPEIEEAIINSQENDNIEDPNFIIGEEISSFENDALKISFRRVKFKKYERFNVTDYNFSLKIDFKKKYQDVLMTTVLDGFLDGLKQTFARVKRDFKHMLDRNMYITFYHKDLVSPIVVGPLNFKEETIESMVKKYETKISFVLTSHTSLSSSHTLFVMIRLLGKKNIESLRLRQGKLNEMDMIPMKGNENEEESK